MKKICLVFALLASAVSAQAADLHSPYLGVSVGGVSGAVNPDTFQNSTNRDTVGVVGGIKVGEHCGVELEFAGVLTGSPSYGTMTVISGTYERAIPETAISVMFKLGAGQVYAESNTQYRFRTTAVAGVALNAAIADDLTLRLQYSQVPNFAKAHNEVGYTSLALIKSF